MQANSVFTKRHGQSAGLVDLCDDSLRDVADFTTSKPFYSGAGQGYVNIKKTFEVKI